MDLSQLQVDSDITQAHTLPGWVYGSEAVFDRIRQLIFACAWHFVADHSVVAQAGSAWPFFLSPGFLHWPLLLTRDSKDELHCFSNVCTHRGNVLVTEPCQVREISCNYHGRRFGLDGCFKSMPGFEAAKNFPTDSDNLHKMVLAQWSSLVFAAANPMAEFEAVFGEIKQRLNLLPHDKLRAYPELSREYSVQANWMLYVENYLEGFHIPFVHPGLNAAIEFGDYGYEQGQYWNLQLGVVKPGEEAFEIPENHPDYGRNIGAYYYWVFPNLMLNYYPWGLSINIVQPLATDRTNVRFLTYVWDESKLHRGAGANLDKVEREDEAIVERVQLGVSSPLYGRGRFSPSMERGVHHFQSLISTFLQR